MKEQLAFNFKEGADIPDSHFYAFKVCNSGKSHFYKPAFYVLKNELLQTYGRPNDFDLQEIEKKCRTCGGSGMYSKSEGCRNCGGSGIWATKKVVLKRYILNGAVFHQPVGELTYDGRLKVFDGYEEDHECGYGYAKFIYQNFHGIIKNKITGTIKHEPYKLSMEWAYLYLLWAYKRAEFHTTLDRIVKSYQTNAQHKFRILISKYTPLKAASIFFKVEKSQLEHIDDLSF